MNRSEDITKLMPAVGAVSHAVQKVQRDGTNPHFKSKYVTLEALMDAVRDPLLANGITLLQWFDKTDGNKVDLITGLFHTSGQFIESVLSIPLDKKNAQAVGSAITYGRRYSISSLLGIVDTNDDDGNKASEEIRYISTQQATNILTLIKDVGADEPKFRAWIKESFNADTLGRIPESALNTVLSTLEAKRGTK